MAEQLTGGDEIREAVRERYARAALDAAADSETGCCTTSQAECGCQHETGSSSASASEDPRISTPLGCGNPTAVADLHPGEVVLDLGSGGGEDVFISAARVGPQGRVYGVDMTDEMLELATGRQRDAGIENVEFLKGTIEDVPLPDDSVDAVISNCVINLSVDKPAVLTEIARVLRPGGRVGVSDVVAEDRLTPEQRAERGSYVGCIAGALSASEYVAGLEAAGFEDVSVEFTHEVADGMHGAIVKAVKGSGLPLVQPAERAGCC